jgi:drug/metabolite transporter (DMT)-like permease
MLHVLALLGVLSISFSAVFVRLAAVSPITATFYRAAYALPVLAVLWLAQRANDGRPARERWMAAASGVILAIDLNLWHESIALLGAGLGTVIANVQVVFVAIASWFLYRERPLAGRIALIAVVLVGVALSSGLGRHDAYGERPVAGAMIGILAGLSYAVFLLVYRAANRTAGPRSGPLLDSTAGMAAGALATAPFDPRFTMLPPAAAQIWLVLLAIGSQVIGWLLIGTALPRLPAVETSVLLLGQPVFAVIWGVLIFRERLSPLQWFGAAIVLVGVTLLSARAARAARFARGSEKEEVRS